MYHGLSVALFESCACNHSEWDEAGEAEQEREGGLACFPFRSSRGPLSRHFIPSHHLSPHTTEAAPAFVRSCMRCQTYAVPPAVRPSSDIQSGADISFASTGIGIAPFPLSRHFTASNPFRGIKGGRSPNCGYKVPPPPLPPTDLENGSGNSSSKQCLTNEMTDLSRDRNLCLPVPLHRMPLFLAHSFFGLSARPDAPHHTGRGRLIACR